MPGAYQLHDSLSDPKGFQADLARRISECGAESGALAEATRDWMIHIHWRKRYGVDVDQSSALEEASLRTVPEKLTRLLPRIRGADRPIPYGKRLMGTCRDFTLMHCALLRSAGIPARPRCGFASYFLRDHEEDHWVTEWFDEGRGRWVLTDAQLDRLMRDVLKISFSTEDLPEGQFTPGGEAWSRCREGDDPERYGIFDMKGWDFIKGNLIRDLASLAGFPMLPWDFWGLMATPFQALSADDLRFLDELARAIPAGTSMGRNEALERFADPRLALPPVIKTLAPSGSVVDADISAILAG